MIIGIQSHVVIVSMCVWNNLETAQRTVLKQSWHHQRWEAVETTYNSWTWRGVTTLRQGRQLPPCFFIEGRNYVEAGEAIASSLFSALMNNWLDAAAPYIVKDIHILYRKGAKICSKYMLTKLWSCLIHLHFNIRFFCLYVPYYS